MTEVYIVLDYYYDGDSYLRRTFMGVFSSFEKAIDYIEKNNGAYLKEEPDDMGDNFTSPGYGIIEEIIDGK
jgi:hypothetical protein